MDGAEKPLGVFSNVPGAVLDLGGDDAGNFFVSVSTFLNSDCGVSAWMGERSVCESRAGARAIGRGGVKSSSVASESSLSDATIKYSLARG